MSLNSFVFILAFLPLTLCFWSLAQGVQKRWVLTVASVVFCSWANLISVVVLLISVAANYFLSLHLAEGRWPDGRRYRLLKIGLFFNVALLFLFKYWSPILQGLHLNHPVELFGSFALPLGLSFYTIQQIMFLVDSYQGLVGPQTVVDYCSFVLFFPQLSAGPIPNQMDTLEQFGDSGRSKLNYDNLARGLFVFAQGLFSKVAVADTLGLWSAAGFDSAAHLSCGESWVTILAYTFQIFFDFSGYTSMALGVALMFNIELPDNFNSPYRATSLVEFWTRWHITLTQFITNYIYYSILSSFKSISFKNAMFSTFVAMLLCGVWHGPAWTYVAWGVVHGLGLFVNHSWKRLKRPLPVFLAWLLTFGFVVLSYVFFGAHSLADAFSILASMANSGVQAHPSIFAGIDRWDTLLTLAVTLWALPGAFSPVAPVERRRAFRPSLRNQALAIGYVLVSFLFLNSSVGRSFIYIDF